MECNGQNSTRCNGERITKGVNMSINGIAESVIKLKGSISLPKAIQGKSAYDIAVDEEGFKGTKKEWLDSLKAVAIEDVQQIVNEIIKNIAKAKKKNVTLLASKWVGTDSPYSQVVTVDGVTENSQVDLTPSLAQQVVFTEKKLVFLTENYGGVVTVYAIGQKPENDYEIQVTITEVEYE